MVKVYSRGIWLTGCGGLALYCRSYRSLVLRLHPHVIRRGKRFLCPGSSFISYPQDRSSTFGPEEPHWVQDSPFELQQSCADGTPVFVLFFLVRSLPFYDSTFCTKDDKEQILATMVHDMDIRRSVRIPIDPLPFLSSCTAFWSPEYTPSVRHPR